uniref:DUF4283 domain-containing protein n=1 Tax=Cannabis sativa TaxID=3483 RepID=A0A803NHH6_CANSA
MDEVLEIEPILFFEEEDDTEVLVNAEEVHSPALDLNSIRREEIRMDFSHFLETKQYREAQNLSAIAVARGKDVIPPILRSGNIVRNLDSKFAGSPSKRKIKITKEDIQEEVDFWTPSIICYVLGANPPMSILEGFVRRVWKDKIDKVGMISHGVFLVRFRSIADRDQILSRGYIFFNKRPVIMRAWDPNVNFKKENIHSVPIWVQLKNLDLKYWGEQVLFKIISQVGEPVMVDAFTKAREKLTYPRILIEVSMQQEFPEQIWFEDENDEETSVLVPYEWKPTTCAHCKGIGHETKDCRNKEGKKSEWVVKKPAVNAQEFVQVEGEDGFIPAKKIWKEKNKAQSMAINIHVANSYSLLQEPIDVELGHSNT